MDFQQYGLVAKDHFSWKVNIVLLDAVGVFAPLTFDSTGCVQDKATAKHFYDI